MASQPWALVPTLGATNCRHILVSGSAWSIANRPAQHSPGSARQGSRPVAQYLPCPRAGYEVECLRRGLGGRAACERRKALVLVSRRFEARFDILGWFEDKAV